jgi:hypothetical protein
MENNAQSLEIQRLKDELSSKVEYIHELYAVKEDYKALCSELKQKINEMEQTIDFLRMRSGVVASGCSPNCKKDIIEKAFDTLYTAVSKRAISNIIGLTVLRELMQEIAGK